MALTYKKSRSGRYRVALARSFPRRGFTYKPGTALTVSQSLLDEMIAAEVVADVRSAD